MALPTSPPISLTQILDEFGASDFADACSKAGLTPPVSFSDFLGLSAATLLTTWSGKTYSSYDDLFASASITFSNSGSWSGAGANSGSWLDGGNPADFEIYVAKGPGGTPSGTLNTWLSLDSSRTWTITASNGQTNTASLSVQIRKKTDTSMSVSGNVTLSATASINPDL